MEPQVFIALLVNMRKHFENSKERANKAGNKKKDPLSFLFLFPSLPPSHSFPPPSHHSSLTVCIGLSYISYSMTSYFQVPNAK